MFGIHLPWCVQKNHLLIFSSFLDIWENVEWPRFFGPPCRSLQLHKRNFTLKSGGDHASPGFGVRQARRSRRRRREHRRAKGAEWGRVWGVVSPPQPTMGSGERVVELPQRGPGRPLSHFLHVLGHRTLLLARKIRFSCPNSKVQGKIGIFIWEKVVVTSHYRHIQSCAYDGLCF